MLTHDNVTWTCRIMLKYTPKGYLDETDVVVSYLPLSHIAAQQLDLYMPAGASNRQFKSGIRETSCSPSG